MEWVSRAASDLERSETVGGDPGPVTGKNSATGGSWYGSSALTRSRRKAITAKGRVSENSKPRRRRVGPV